MANAVKYWASLSVVGHSNSMSGLILVMFMPVYFVGVFFVDILVFP